MYGKTLGVANVATGIAMLPNTGDNKLLFVIALSFLLVGCIIFATSMALSIKKKKN